MAGQKSKLSRQTRMAHRLIKTANAFNSAAELAAEWVVAMQDAARECVRLAEEIEEQMKEETK